MTARPMSCATGIQKPFKMNQNRRADCKNHNPKRYAGQACSILGLLVTLTAGAAIPSPEKLLPDDTLVLLTAPDYAKLREISRRATMVQLWSDTAMKPFREHFSTKWNDEFVKPLEREMNIKFDDYTALLNGQLTFALTQNGWQGDSDQEPAFLLLLDAKDKSAQLKKNLADLRTKWSDAGKTLRSEKIREIEFTVLSMSSNDVPKTLRKFFPPSSQVQELGEEKETKPASKKSEFFLGQHDSLLIVGSSAKALEKVANRLTGGSSPCLEESAAYQANHLRLFRDSPCYGWINAKALMDAFLRAAAAKKDNPDAPNPFDLKPEKIINALGFGGLKTVGFSIEPSGEGAQLFLGVPESARQGVFKILAGEPKETTPPPFVPADAVKFQRWRIDGQKAWATLEKMISDISPQWLNGINFLLETANTAAKQKDPGFDIKKNLIGNLGDDMISYERPQKGGTASDGQSPPAIFLLGSPNPDQLAAGLKNILVYLSQQVGTPPEEREFLGRKIYSMPMRPLGLPGSDPGKSGPSTLHYAASRGYVAFSADASMIEAFLRTSESEGKALRETSGLTEAAQKVTTSGTSLFGYENNVETTRAWLDSLRSNSGKDTNAPASVASNLLPNSLGLAGAGQGFKDWLDFSLLPSFDKISKYFYFTVYGGSSTVDGLTLKAYAPTPPGLRGEKQKR
jgi:hypothetical protein